MLFLYFLYCRLLSEVDVCIGQLAMGTMGGFLQSRNIYCPGYRTGCAPDSDTSCVAVEWHSLGLERAEVKTLQDPSSQLQVEGV